MKKITGIAALLCMFLLGACSSDSNEDNEAEESTNENAEELTIKAFNWQFDQGEYTVPAGEITVYLSNEEGHHGIEIEGTDISIEGDGSASDTLEAGEYTIRCSIPCGEGHSDMIATLVVQ
ncbi:cytochrome C oxidase subunit II [Oceanobacillus jeddahense]|uniref:Cytochrome C oxidase subunit II n=1 Tax=Oceanobacillus jeddahense TaxID=1462527 RepID=A0ABY5JZ50_9BACI|nr:cytochrome C oxidase subunit II [Oceanobacillus jeddahense]UUI04331.1 cytochrome C oxidase subunit II [Oceanobacillus jeddahense]